MDYKIQTPDAYYIVSEDSSLDEAALLKLAFDIKGLAKITQPNFLIDMRFDYEMVQLQALHKITEQLQPIIQSKLDKTNTLFPSTAGVNMNNGRNEIEVVLPLNSFGWARQHYNNLRRALYAIPTIQICYPKWSTEKGYLLHGTGSLCTYVAINRNEKDKRQELVHFFFSMEIATCLINPQFGFTKLLQQTLELSKNVYTSKLYMYISRSADQGKWVISYKNLREKLCIGKKFPRYYDFRTRILKEAESQLRQNSNYWFDLVECFPRKGASAPDILIFNIYSTNDTQSGLTKLNTYKAKILETMVVTLNIKKSSAKSICHQINIRNMDYIWRKHNSLIGYMASEDHIDDNEAYYLGAIRQIIQSEKYSQPALQQQLF